MAKKKSDARPVMDRMIIRWHFPDGTSIPQPFREHADTIKDEAMKASLSDDDELRRAGIDLLAEHPDKYGEIRANVEYSKLTGQKGGQAQKKNPWAEIAANLLARETVNAKDEAAWQSVPESITPWILTDPGNKFIEIEIYRDGGEIHFTDADTRKAAARSLKKSVFLKNYYRPARNSG